ncbi:HIV-1 Vpr-binding protein isoform 1 [Galdieria sulphuraria]|uniref:HIV-1 Vpr-binding protein isoform 1 n=1 Tax=Galdieria sulphuraria TaxID=130081 RepID=M2WTQ2_GALSU|nr:HIV-1 Vpr-binding protein isoform 2 [Galdieria sulphuraria]XP_005703810.1 HIV-1 Vpr-binding protein isoform 1 [Galdieria sulphuraria]EME27289.1 HIV-1 Vpr-binding protein isoform 2 [Galdieria sulphuraria]EME27290.1 HIV-1 Vpr-binding protein isoform 1 [Galdieria sulphuraria]|eukprot:XP_005703809.1 HIV-1 Vpr-binding protein isoform 2 [Galdieria sulphuraria]
MSHNTTSYELSSNVDNTAVEAQMDVLIEGVVNALTETDENPTELQLLASRIHGLAAVLEEYEERFRETATDAIDNERDDFPIGVALGTLLESEEIISAARNWFSRVSLTLSTQNNLSANFKKQVFGAWSRLLIACLESGEEEFADMTSDESVLNALFAWFNTSDNSDEESLALRSWTTGLLAYISEMIPEVADSIIREGLGTTAVSRLFALVLGPNVVYELEGTRVNDSSVVIQPVNRKLYFEEVRRKSSSANLDYTEMAIARELQFLLHLLESIGDYEEILPYILSEFRGLQCIFTILTHCDPAMNIQIVDETLHMVSSLLAHKAFGKQLVEKCGIDVLLRVPPLPYLQYGLSMCLSQLALIPQVLETICRLSDGVEKCTNLVKLGLRFIESQQKSVRKNAAQFIASAVQHPRFYTRFNKLHGTQILLAAIQWHEENSEMINEVDIQNELVEYTSEYILHALRQLVRSEMTLLAEYIKYGSFKGMDFCVALALDSESLATAFAILRAYCLQKKKLRLSEIFTHHYYGKTIEIIVEQDGFAILTSRISAALRSHSSTVTQYVLEILEVLTVPLVYHEKLLSLPSTFMVGDMDAVDDESAYSPEDGGALALIVRAAGPRFHREYLVVAASLRVICNLVHPKGWCPSSEYFLKYGISKSTIENLTEDDGLNMQREAIRKSNGIRVLLWRLRVRAAPDKSDMILFLVVRALQGLARQRMILQVLNQLHVSEILADIVRQSTASGGAGSLFQTKFRTEALDLSSRVAGGGLSLALAEAYDPTLRSVARAAAVSSTPVSFSEQELLQLIHDFLRSRKLFQTASSLIEEANIQPLPSITGGSPRTPRPVSVSYNNKSFNTPSFRTPTRERLLAEIQEQQSSRNSLETIVKGYLLSQHSKCLHPASLLPPFSLLKPHRCPVPEMETTSAPRNIVRLMKQREVLSHQRQFRDGRMRGATRRAKRFVFSKFRSRRTYKFASSQTPVFHPAEKNISCVCFLDKEDCSPLDNFGGLLVCSLSGAVRRYGIYPMLHSIDNYEEWRLLQDNDLFLWSITRSFDSKQLLLGCSDSHRKRQFGNSGKLCLWQTDNLSGMMPNREFQHDEYAPQYGIFSKNSEKILAAGPLGSLLYHTESGEVLHKFRNPPDIERTAALRNRPCWSPNESLILSAGALWDSRRARMVHRFESLGTVSNACFHPSGLEVIIGSEMWDLRTFKLLRSVPALGLVDLQFTSCGELAFGIPTRYSNSMRDLCNRENLRPTAFTVFDACDYSEISSVDLGCNVWDLQLDNFDSYAAVCVSDYRLDEMESESFVRLFEIGAGRKSAFSLYLNEEEEEEEKEEEASEMGTDYDMSSDSNESSLMSYEEDDEDEDEDDGSSGDEEQVFEVPMFDLVVDDEMMESDSDDDDDDFSTDETRQHENGQRFGYFY